MSSPSPIDQMMGQFGQNTTVPAPSGPVYSPLPRELDNFMAALLIICGVPALFLNAVVVAVGLRGWKYIKPMEIYIINVAVADLAWVTIMYPLVIPALCLHYWPWGHTVCIVYGFVGFFFGTVTMMSLTVLSVSRYLIFRSSERSNTNNHRVVFMVLAAIYLYSLLWSTPPLWGIGQGYGLEPHATSCCLLWSKPGYRPYLLSMLLMVLVLPACAMVTSYVLIVKRIRGVKSYSDALGNRVFKMTILMCGIFLLAWTPYGIFAIWRTVRGPEYTTVPIFSALPAIFAKCVSVNNPTVHFLFNQKFRQLTLKLFGWSSRVSTAPALPNNGIHPEVSPTPGNHRPGVVAGIHPHSPACGIREKFPSICLEDPPMAAAAESSNTPMSTLSVKQLVSRAPTIPDHICI